jgi:hypothetical protein
MIIKNRERVALMLQEFWHALRKFWNSLFGKGAIATSGGGTPLAGKSRQPFAALVNPFTSGVAVEMSPEDLVVHSFRGLEAWAEKHHCGRHPDQTPFEFADNVAAEVPDLAHEAQQVTSLYVQVAYAKAAVLPACRTILEILWSKMTEAP